MSIVVSYPHVSDPSATGATVSFPDEATAQLHSNTAWRQLQTEDRNEVGGKLADDHIKATEVLLARMLKHLKTATGPGGYATEREDYRRLAQNIEQNGLAVWGKLLIGRSGTAAAPNHTGPELCPTCGRDSDGLQQEDHDRLRNLRRE